MLACAAPAPTSVAALISGLQVPAGERVRYREEIYHPALPVPEIATGSMWVAASGAMMRDQMTPRREISEIGTSTVRLRSAPEEDPTVFPIPARLRGTLEAMRLVLTGGSLPDATEAELVIGDMGWSVLLDLGDGRRASLIGCGKRARGIETENDAGVRRLVRFLGPE